MTDLLYKTTSYDGACVYGKGSWEPGTWRTVTQPLVVCSHGIHYCRRNDLVRWLNEEVWLFEDGAPETAVDGCDKMVTTKGRIVERVETWNGVTARLFAADCAEAVLPIFYKVRPDDDRPQKAIEKARSYARGEISAAARDAARAAARDAQTALLFDYLEGRKVAS